VYLPTANFAGNETTITQLVTPGTPTTIIPGLTQQGTQSQQTIVNTFFGETLQVTVLNEFDEPIEGVDVMFTITTVGGASGSFFENNAYTDTIIVTTNSSGVATTPLILANTVAGTYEAIATTESLPGPVNFQLTNLPDAAAGLVFLKQPPPVVAINAKFKVKVQLVDQFGNIVQEAGRTIRWRLSTGAVLGSSLTDDQGIACFFVKVAKPGTYRLTADLMMQFAQTEEGPELPYVSSKSNWFKVRGRRSHWG
jgi:hypothetical protein